MKRAAVILAAALLPGCGEGESAAPPTEALHLPESVRVVGHAHECSGATCTRFLLVAPAFEGGTDVTGASAVRREVRKGLLEDGWEVAGDAATSTEHAAEATIGGRTAETLENQRRSMTDAGQPIVTVRLTRRG